MWKDLGVMHLESALLKKAGAGCEAMREPATADGYKTHRIPVQSVIPPLTEALNDTGPTSKCDR